MATREQLEGCLLGTAIGDALLLPGEGLPAHRQPQDLRHRLVGPWGLISDDTEHAFLTAQALLASGGDPDRFGRALAWRLRGWLCSISPGIGLATLRACLRLCLGWSYATAGVGSAGNGPAMRAAVIGAVVAEAERRRTLVTIAARITHTDSRAIAAARAVAEAAAWIVAGSRDPEALWHAWREVGEDPRWRAAVEAMLAADRRGAEVERLADDLGVPGFVTGYACTSVPIALYAWWRQRDDLPGILHAIRRCGGDVDTMGAIAGALSGLEGGVHRCPESWITGIVDWPLSISTLRRCAGRLVTGGSPVGWCWPLLPVRGLLVLGVALAHGYARVASRWWRRLFPIGSHPRHHR